MINNDYKHSALTEAIIGCAMRVHTALGKGYPEVYYQRALSLELAALGIEHQREVNQPVYYQGTTIGSRRLDFLVADCVVVELKALPALDNVHIAQTLNYLQTLQLEVALLLNFGTSRLQFRRLIHTVPPILEQLP